MDSQTGGREHRGDDDLARQAGLLLTAGVVGVIAGEGAIVRLANDYFLDLLGYHRGDLVRGPPTTTRPVRN